MPNDPQSDRQVVREETNKDGHFKLIKNMNYDPQVHKMWEVIRDDQLVVEYEAFETALNYYNRLISFGQDHCNEFFSTAKVQ